MRRPADMPAYSVLATALRCCTEILAREVATPSSTPPDWSDFEWEVARAVAAMQGITVLLANRLRWRGPENWQSFVETQRGQALQRHARIESLLEQLDSSLRAAGLTCVALKGSAIRKLPLYQRGERPMGDIDLLARPGDAPRIEQVLQSLDYGPGRHTQRHAIFEPRLRGAIAFGEHPDNPLRIEVHELIAEPLPFFSVDITGSLWSGDARPGLNAYPHARELMRHLLLHAAGNMRAHALRQVQLHDIAMLAGVLDDDDWRALQSTPESRGGAWWMWPVLQLTARCYPGRLPARVADFRRLCPALLQAASANYTLTRVSWSNLRIAALPGLCWSRSAREALGFVGSRLAPPRQALDELGAAIERTPALRHVPWYGETHFKRVLRWVFSRPPRVQTLVSVRAALAEDPAKPLNGA